MSVSQYRILVVDDEESVRTSERRFLEDGGFTVAEAADGVQALELLRTAGADLVLLDLRMPRLSGIETLKRIRVEWPELPAIVASGAGTMHDVVQALRLGAWDYLAKPIEDLNILGHAINGALERSRLIRENRHYQRHLEEEVDRRAAELKGAYAANVMLEQQFHEAQKMESVGRLAGGVAHDLNNLLSPILGYGEMLMRHMDASDAHRTSVEQMVRAGERARDLVLQLLAFSRKQVLEFKPIDLNLAVTGFEKLLRRTIREDIGIKFFPGEPVPAIRGDVGQLEQVLMNLAVNAQDAMPDGGRLTIETATTNLDDAYAATHPEMTPGRYVMLAVSDTGHGMNAATQARLFEPFFTTKPVGQGTGLGLATSYGIVKQHGGHICAYSEWGKGTTFKIYLPALETAVGQASATPAPASEDLRGTEAVLLVEDDDMVREVTRIMIEQHGYTVLLARNGTEAMSIMEKHDGAMHLLLTDVVMPEMNGRELFAIITAKYPNLRVLFMSGYAASAIAHGGILDEGVNFIQKPFTMHQLASKIRNALAGG